MTMRGSSKLVMVAAVLFMAVMLGGSAEASLAEQCSSKITNVMTCLGFASGKEAAPEKKCCDSVSVMRDTNAACLCFIIQQIHNGTDPVLQKMNIQEARLVQLPSACQLVNASITDCPRLLNLPPHSPESAIFTSNSTTVSPIIGTTSPSTTGQGSNGFIHQVPKFTVLILVTIAVLPFVFPNGLVCA